MRVNNIGEILRKQGRYDAAMQRYEESLAIKRRLGNEAGIAATLNNMAFIAFRRGEYGEALRLLCQTLAIQRRSGIPTKNTGKGIAVLKRRVPGGGC